MITQLTIDEVGTLIKTSPEQAIYDWKTDFTLPADDEKRGEILKDISAIANAITTSYGFIIYGVDPRKPDPIIGISTSYDDAKLQQLIKGKIEPPVNFLYYEVTAGLRIVGIIQITPTRNRPHIIKADIGKVRNGQIVIRRGSSTDGVGINDLFEFFYGNNSIYFKNVLNNLKVNVEQQNATTNYLRELREQSDQARRDMEDIIGFRLR